MLCKEYQPWINDAAAGAIPAERDAELRAHMADCPNCRKAFESARRLQAAIDAGLIRIVSSEPSPQVLAAVRQKIAARAVQRRSRSVSPVAWRAALVAAGLLAVAAGLKVWNARPSHLYKQVLVSSASARPPRLTTHRGLAKVATLAPESRPEQAPQSGATKPHVNHAAAGARRSASARQPQVLVEKDEAALVMGLYEGLQSSRVEAASLLKTPPGFKRERDGSLVTVPLEIPPIKIARLDSGGSKAGKDPRTL
jgi:hypothetical protein